MEHCRDGGRLLWREVLGLRRILKYLVRLSLNSNILQ